MLSQAIVNHSRISKCEYYLWIIAVGGSAGLSVIGDLLHINGHLFVDPAAQFEPEPFLGHVAECALWSTKLVVLF